MKEYLKKNGIRLAVILLAVLLVVSVSSQLLGGSAGFLTNIILAVREPINKAATAAGSLLDGLYGYIFEYEQLQAELEATQMQLAEAQEEVRAAIDLNDAWTKAGAQGTMTMGCVVVRTEFAQENPQAVENFLEEYEESITYVSENPEEAAALVVEAGIVPKEPIAKAAIPQANLVCITGEDMLGIQDYYRVLWDADPASIGGAIPDDAFYYLP